MPHLLHALGGFSPDPNTLQLLRLGGLIHLDPFQWKTYPLPPKIERSFAAYVCLHQPRVFSDQLE